MRHAWMQRNGGDGLLVFFAGWGMDPRPFEYLSARELDVMLLFDYRETQLPDALLEALDRYAGCFLLAWSLGVAVANLCCGTLASRFAVRAAVNGTVRPVDAEEGISPEVFDGTIRQLDAGGLARFIRRTCVRREIHDRYLLHPAQRSLSEIREELQVLRDIEVSEDCLFDVALAGREDRIFPHESQVRCWGRRGVPCLTLEEPHFPFYAWSSWEDVLHACRSD